MSSENQSLLEWLRAELRDDREQIADKSLGEWALTLVETFLALALFARTAVYSVVYSVNHAKPGAEISFGLLEEPLTSEHWRDRDRVQAGILCGIVAIAIGSWPMDASAIVSGYLLINGSVLLLEPLRVALR